MESLNTLMQRYFEQFADTGIPEVQQATSTTQFGEQNAPTAGTAIATTSALSTGTWEITCYTNLSGTTAGLDRPNLAFKVGSTTLATILSTLGGVTDVFSIRVNLTSATAVSVVAIATSTAGSVYRATIVANKVSG